MIFHDVPVTPSYFFITLYGLFLISLAREREREKKKKHSQNKFQL